MGTSAPNAPLLGIDAGGTKLHFRLLYPETGTHRDTVLPAGDWTAIGAHEKAELLASHVARISAERPSAIGLGAHGCDSDEECDELRTALALAIPGVPIRVVNDAFLLPIAGSHRPAAGMVVGTGSIAVASTADGGSLYAGGWGWLIGDHGSAWGLVRDAVVALARAADAGVDPELDPLLPALREAAGARTLREIADAMEVGPAQLWATWAPLVFDAAAAGSDAATYAISTGADSLVELIATLIARGGVIEEVVASGGVITHQPLLEETVARRLAERLGLELRVFRGYAVEGAVTIAAELVRNASAAAVSLPTAALSSRPVLSGE